MILLRTSFLAFMMILALALGAYQVVQLWNWLGIAQLVGSTSEEVAHAGLRAFAGLITLGCGITLLALQWFGRKHVNPHVITLVVWLTLPFKLLVRLYTGPSSTLNRVWRGLAAVLLLFILNGWLVLMIGLALDPEEGLRYGVATIAFQFFVFIDFHLVRTLRTWFSSGATAFISLRYLRKRPISLLSVLGVTAGTFVMIVVNSVMTGFLQQYKSEIQGSLSQVILRSKLSQYNPQPRDVRNAMWATCLKYVHADPKLLRQWEHAIALAQQALEADSPGVSLPETMTEFPTGDRPVISGVTQEALNLREELDSEEGADAGRYLRYLPRHPVLQRADPIGIWRASQGVSEDQREQKMRELERDVRSMLFLPRLELGNRFLRESISAFHGVEALSHRMQSMAPIGKEGGSFQETAVVAIDQELEPRTTNVGKYVADAELREFKLRVHVQPLVRILNFSLMFEDPATAPDRSELSPLVVSDQGEVSTNYDPEENYLRWRGILRYEGDLTWSMVDRIRYRKDSPGDAIRELVGRRIRKLEGALTAEVMREQLELARNELSALIRERAPDVLRAIPDDFGVGLPAALPDDATLLHFLQESMLTGRQQVIASASDATSSWLSDLRRRVATDARDFTDDGAVPDALTAAVEDFGNEIQAGLNALRDAPDRASMAAALSETQGRLVGKIQVFRNAHPDIPEVFLDSALLLREAVDRPAIITGVAASRHPTLRSSPGDFALNELLEAWEELWSHVDARMKAYATLLPLRTVFIPGESVEEYQVRARTMLPWIDHSSIVYSHPTLLERARRLIGERFDYLLQHRLRSASVPEAVKPRLADMATVLSRWNSEVRKEADSIDALQRSVFELREELFGLLTRSNASANESKPSPEDIALAREALAPLWPSQADLRDEFWRLMPTGVSIIAGDALANTLRLVPRDMLAFGTSGVYEVSIYAPRSSISAARRDPDKPFEGDFASVLGTVSAVFRSGLFDDNLHTFYSDYESWVTLMGASVADYMTGVRLKDYRPWDGQPEKLQELLVDHLRKESRRITADTNLPVEYRDAAMLAASGGNTHISIWEQERANMLKAVETERNMISLLIALVVGLSGVLILIVVYLTVVEKVKDIGVLAALGASPWATRSIFSLNALFIGLFGAVAGGLLGIVTCENLPAIEDFIHAQTGFKLFPADIYYLTYVPTVKGSDLWELALNFAVPTVLWSFFCGILPASIAARKRVVESLHYE